jgi:3-phenylpropionate/trans-cinnamate dioxygenase ferredoxin component
MAETRQVDVYGIRDLEPGTMVMTSVDDVDILLVNLDGSIHAIQGSCAHEYANLAEGELDGSTLTCALHFSMYDVRDGSVLRGPAGQPLVTYPVEIVAGRINLRLPVGEIPVNE